GHAPVQPSVLDDDVSGDVSLAADLFPREPGIRPAHLAGLLRRILQLVARGAMLQDQALAVHSVPEGLAQFIGYRDNLGHRVAPCVVRRSITFPRAGAGPASGPRHRASRRLIWP